MKTFRKLLIANRGEIALRVIRTARAMGLATVAVHSDADAEAPHARAADEAVNIGLAPSKDSYLAGGKIIAAAQRTSCDALHPGYGFLSENAEFAEACASAGLVFIGPAPEAIRRMGLKSAARQLAVTADVSVVPGYDGPAQHDETLREYISKIGFPVLIKASAGGGGKGMRIVRSEAEIAEALASARREAEKAFGDDTLLLEKYVEQARHVEVQIFGDAHGHLVHLFERDCSLQRRHQKIIEESPSPAVTPELRAQLGAAAVRIGKAIGYVNAGTVEFILGPDSAFYFIEVNTRLQVEHPVTELITGLDLVKLQIEVAEGKPLPFTQEELSTSGHAIEARLYAEDPRNDFLPATGTLRAWRVPEDVAGLRVDAGVECGSAVGIYYDPLLAKLIAHGADRAAALRKLSYGLRNLRVQGVQTNRDFLLRLLECEEFQQGRATTAFIGEQLDYLLQADNAEVGQAAVIAVALYLQNKWRAADELGRELPPGYRNNPYRNPRLKLQLAEKTWELAWQGNEDGGFAFYLADTVVQVQLLAHTNDGVRYALNGVQREFAVTEADGLFYVHSALGSCVVSQPSRYPEHQSAAEQGAANSPMPGQVLKVLVEVGRQVVKGEALLILEAMKMEHTMRAALNGVVEAITVSAGQVVGPGEVLVKIKAS